MLAHLVLVTSHTNYGWSLEADDANMDCARYDVVAQCGCGLCPGFITTHGYRIIFR
jgi:hypothetical protein